MTQPWLLPDHIEDVLPPQAAALASARETLLSLFESFGYARVCPPSIEYIDSLLTGTGEGNDLLTFKMIDQATGRTLGLRPDITPQVARIDAHRLQEAGVTRLCYEGAVFHAVAESALHSRERLQVGAELYGHAGLEADLEVLALLVEALHTLALPQHMVDLGHVGIFRALLNGVGQDQETALLLALQEKNLPRIAELTEGLQKTARDALRHLPVLTGGPEVLQEARRVLPRNEAIEHALRELDEVAKATAAHERVEFDLSELRGYDYHTGLVFAVYVEGFAGAVARGGRYDAVGEVFGRARPATGFSIDLGDLIEVLPSPPVRKRAWCPHSLKASMPPHRLQQELRALRAQGWIVVSELKGQAEPDWSGFNAVLAEGPHGLLPTPLK